MAPRCRPHPPNAPERRSVTGLRCSPTSPSPLSLPFGHPRLVPAQRRLPAGAPTDCDFRNHHGADRERPPVV